MPVAHQGPEPAAPAAGGGGGLGCMGAGIGCMGAGLVDKGCLPGGDAGLGAVVLLGLHGGPRVGEH